MAKSPTTRRGAPRKPPINMRLRNMKTGPAPRKLSKEPTSTASRASGFAIGPDSPYPTSEYSAFVSPALPPPSSAYTIRNDRYNAMASAQLQHELNATLPMSSYPITPAELIHPARVENSSNPTTQASNLVQVRSMQLPTVGDNATDPIDLDDPSRLYIPSSKSRGIRDGFFSPSKEPTRGPRENSLPKGSTPATKDRSSKVQPRRPTRVDKADDVPEEEPIIDVRGIRPQKAGGGARPPTRHGPRGNATTPAIKDSYPGPFKQLSGYGDNIRRESNARRPSTNAATTGPTASGTPRGGTRTTQSPSRSRSKSVSRGVDEEEIPDGGLDMDLDDDYVYDSNLGKSPSEESRASDARHQRLMEAFNQATTALELQKQENSAALQVAQIEMNQAEEQRLELEDRVAVLQQQFEDVTTQAQAQVDGTEERGSGSLGQAETTRNMDNDMIQELVENEARLQSQVAGLRAELEEIYSGSGEQQQNAEALGNGRDAGFEAKANRLDALYDLLRNFRDMEARIGDQHELKARNTYLEAVVRKAKAHINGTGDDNGDVDNQEGDVMTAEANARSRKESGGRSTAGPGDSAKDLQELETEKNELLYEIDDLDGEVKTLRARNDLLESIVKKSKDDSDAVAEQLKRANDRFGETYNDLLTSRAENRELQQKLAEANKSPTAGGKRAGALQEVSSLLQKARAEASKSPTAGGKRAEALQEVSSLLQKALAEMVAGQEQLDEEVAELQRKEGDDGKAPDGPPKAKRARRSTPSDDDEEEEEQQTRFRREYEAAKPDDPRGGVVVIDRGEAARGARTAERRALNETKNARKRKSFA